MLRNMQICSTLWKCLKLRETNLEKPDAVRLIPDAWFGIGFSVMHMNLTFLLHRHYLVVIRCIYNVSNYVRSLGTMDA